MWPFTRKKKKKIEQSESVSNLSSVIPDGIDWTQYTLHGVDAANPTSERSVTHTHPMDSHPHHAHSESCYSDPSHDSSACDSSASSSCDCSGDSGGDD